MYGYQLQPAGRVLFVVLPESLHAARWINQIVDKGWELHFFPSVDVGKIHPDVKNVTVYYSIYGSIGKKNNPGNKYCGVYFPGKYGPKAGFILRQVLSKLYPNYRLNQLKRLICRLKPDIIHSLEIRYAGYLTLEAKKSLSRPFPPWIVTNYGLDIHLWGRLKEHKKRIKEVLASCDFYSYKVFLFLENKNIGRLRTENLS